MFHPTFLAQKVRIQLVRIHIIVCEAKAGTVEVLCKNNTPLLHCCWQCVFEPRNELQITKDHVHAENFALLSCDTAHAQTLFSPVRTELKNANDYVSALRHRTWAQARPHLK